MQLILSPWNDPVRNCALERYLLTERPGDVLLLYINTPSVIVGRNQTVEAEVDAAWCAAEGTPIVRRLSGGGTVYHDDGNVNYAFFCDRGESPALDRDFSEPIIAVLRKLGVEAIPGRRRELLCGGRKISGTASHVTRGRQLFHGTLLHRTDLQRMERALRGDPALRGKGVASVPSAVMNICELTGPKEPTSEFLQRLAAELLRYYDLKEITSLPDSEMARMAQL